MLSGFAFAEDNGDDTLEIMLSNMTLREKVAQMMIASFRVWQEVPETEDGEQPAEESPKTNITELNDEIREMVARNHFGGILLFGENFADPEQTLRLVSDLQMSNQNGGGIPQLIFVDQEGGNVNRIPYSTIGVSNMALGASGDPDRQYNQMVDIRNVPDLVMDDSEHIVDYQFQYQYCLNISFNEEGTPGRGSAIFLHCFGPQKPWTGG